MTSDWQTHQRPSRLRILTSRKSTRIATWNVRTMFQIGKAENVAREMTRNNIGILGITEARWNGSGECFLNNGIKVCYSGQPLDDDSHIQGVALMLSKTAQKSLISWSPKGPRLLEAKFKTSNKNINLRIIVAYAPTNEAEEENKDEFYNQLTGVFNNNFCHKDITLIIGDLNAKVGNTNNGVEQAMGTHAPGERNENGERFVNFCMSHNLVIGGTLFPHKDIHKATWISPNGQVKNQIDHICINGKFRRSLLDVRAFRGADANSDHYLLVGTLQLKLKSHQQNVTSRVKYDTNALKSTEVLDRFKLELTNRFETLSQVDEENESVEDSWQQIKNTFNSTGQTVLGRKRKENKPWISQKTLDFIEKRRYTKQKVLANPESKHFKDEYETLNKAIKKSAKKDKKDFIEDKAAEAELAANQHRMKDVYDITKQISGKNKKSGTHIRDKLGNLIEDHEELKNRWVEHFSELLNRPEPEEEVHIEPSDPLDINCNPPNIHEIKEAIKKLKNNKASGPDDIPAEFLKADITTSAKVMEPLIRKIWTKEIFPDDWKNGYISILPKKGDLTKCENYRGIMLLSVPGKVLSNIILNRIKYKVNETLRPNQAGFRPGRSCTDQTATLRIILEQVNEWNSPLFVNFIDYQKAFDSLDRKTLWKIMKHYGIPEKLINLVKAMYKNSGGSIIFKGSVSKFFEIKTGVRQGCLLSPFLFLLAIDYIMKTSVHGKTGIQWTISKQLEDLDFADDVALFSTTRSQMLKKTEEIASNSEKLGLKINIPKTKILCVNTPKEPIPLKGEIIENVDSFCYLGSIVEAGGGTEADIKARINKGRVAFSMLRRIWNSGSLSLKTKLKLFKSNVLSVLTYGSETWSLTKILENKIQTFVNTCLRQIKKIFWPRTISNEDLWKSCGISKIGALIQARKWRWLGHTLRKGQEEISKTALKWNPQGRRKRGRPKITWRRQLEAEMGQRKISWMEAESLAKRRKEWRSLVHGLYPP